MISQGAPGFRWIILLVLSASNAFTIGVLFLTASLAPFLQAELAISRAEVGLMMAAMLVGAAMTSVPGGWMANRSVRWTIVGCQGLSAVSLVFFSRADSLQWALLGVFGTGLAMGAILTALTKAVASWFGFKERATALGLYFAGGSIGSATGALVLPSLSLALGWRTAVLLVAILVLTVGILGFSIYRDNPASRPEARVPSGSAPGNSRGVGYSNILVMGLIAILLGGPQYALATYLILYLKESQSFSVVEAGVFLSIVQGTSLFGRIGWGIVSDRLLGGNRKAILVISSALFALCFAVIATGFSAYAGLVGLMFLAGISGFSWYGIWMTLIAETSGTISATFIGLGQCFSYIGVIIGPPVFGYVVDTSGSYTPAWIGCAALSALSAVIALLIKQNRTGLASAARSPVIVRPMPRN